MIQSDDRTSPGLSGPLSKSWLTRWWDALHPIAQSLVVMLAMPLLVLNVWAISLMVGYFHSIFVTLLIAALLAFLLSYPMASLEKLGLKRGQSAI
jgi:predicted PurR-regulated permease PerM